MRSLFEVHDYWNGFIKAVSLSKHLRRVVVNGPQCPQEVKVEIREAIEAHQLDHLSYLRINDWRE